MTLRYGDRHTEAELSDGVPVNGTDLLAGDSLGLKGGRFVGADQQAVAKAITYAARSITPPKGVLLADAENGRPAAIQHGGQCRLEMAGAYAVGTRVAPGQAADSGKGVEVDGNDTAYAELLEPSTGDGDLVMVQLYGMPAAVGSASIGGG